MRPPRFIPVHADDIPNLPEGAKDLEPLLDCRDEQLKTITNILSKGVGAGDNTNSDSKEIAVYDDTTYDISYNTEIVKGRPRTVELEETISLFDYTQLKWTFVELGKVRISVKFNSSPTNPVTIRIRIWGP